MPSPLVADGIRVVYVDAALIVLDKPSALLSVPGRGADKADCLATRVQACYPDALTVHRLDQATSGLVVMARGKAVQRLLGIAFGERGVDKRYVAVVAGRPAPAAGDIDLPLIADWPNRPRRVVDRALGKPCLTRYRTLAEDAAGEVTRVELEPVTGRTHQLRVHLQAIGHAILGDQLYADPAVAAASPRLLLHAAQLAFAHPLTQEALDFASPPPF